MKMISTKIPYRSKVYFIKLFINHKLIKSEYINHKLIPNTMTMSF